MRKIVINYKGMEVHANAKLKRNRLLECDFIKIMYKGIDILPLLDDLLIGDWQNIYNEIANELEEEESEDLDIE